MWSNSKTCHFWHGEQKNELWKKIRLMGVGSSTAHGFAFGNRYGRIFHPPQHFIDVSFGKEEVEINERMLLGIRDESKIFDCHQKILENSCSHPTEKPLLTTVGIAIFKKNPIYRASNDSLVYDPSEEDPYGCGEYKRVQKIYPQFSATDEMKTLYFEYEGQTITVGLEENPFNYPNSSSPIGNLNTTKVYDSHYAQMQFQMAVTGRSWCDYVVACFEKNFLHYQRVRFNPSYWKKLDRAIMKNLEPFMDEIDEKIYLPPLNEKGRIPKEERFLPDEIWKKIVPR